MPSEDKPEAWRIGELNHQGDERIAKLREMAERFLNPHALNAHNDAQGADAQR